MADRNALAQLLKALGGALPSSDRQWEAVIATANDTLTTSTLAERLLERHTAADLPPEVRQFLETIRDRARRRGEMMDRQLEEALVALNKAGLVPVLIKGSALRANPTRDEGRLLSDLDLVLSPRDKVGAIEALDQAGYTCREAWAVDSKPVVLARESDAGMIDLQFGFGGAGIQYDFPTLASASREQAFGSGRALVPDATTQAALFIIHDQIKDQDYWRGLIELRHLLDIALLAGGIDWQRLAERFTTPHARAALQTQLVALSRLLSVPIPAHLTGGGWPALQHRRRMLQLEMPSLFRPLTALTVIGDVIGGRMRLKLRREPSWHLGMAPQVGRSEHLFRERSLGKL